METTEGKGPGVGGFLSKILGTGVKEAVDSIGNAIDKIDKSDEKLEIQLKYKQLLMDIESSYIGYESKLLESRAKIVESEAKGESWLQRNWRPMLMLICMFIVLNNYVLVPYFNIPVATLDDHIWRMMEMGVTGYVAGRSLEKISENLGPVLFNPKRKNRS
jgi:DNA repair exonuclease SbcCD ATPase subunit